MSGAIDRPRACQGQRSLRPIPIEGSEFVLPVDSVVLAIGTTPNPLLTRTTSGLLTNKKGCLAADENTGLTSKALVFAGGDAVTGAPHCQGQCSSSQ